MSKHKVHFSSATNEWSTPLWLFHELDLRFDFNLDPCADVHNALCPKFYTKKDNGLEQTWQSYRVFMNPPYGREIKHWVQKAAEEYLQGSCLVMALLPARTDTIWWNDWVVPFASIKFLKGRLKFGGAKNSAPFPSALALYWG